MAKRQTINIKGTEIVLLSQNQNDYISLTDIARYRDNRTDLVIQNWIRTRAAIDILGLWETLHNPSFKPFIYEGFKKDISLNGFVMTPKQWIEQTNAIGLIAKPGKGGGTFAHRDIALEFATWVSVEFKLMLITEFDRLKSDEQKRLSVEWDLQRTLAKINYHIHTDAIKEHIVPQAVSEKQKSFTYANEADLLNVALFGKTAAEWRSENPNKKGNIRDEATLEQLVVLSNLESINALMVCNGLSQSERLVQLNTTAIVQLKSLLEHNMMKRLKEKEKN